MSPVVYRRNGFVFRILLPPREHGPAHVHVERAGTHATFWLADSNLRSEGTMRAADVSQARAIIAARREEFLDSWELYHDEG